jgi:broad specificity phosphatase PhoE
MKYLLVIRHADSEDGTFLSETGNKQVERLVAAFTRTFPLGTRFKFLSSKPGRAMRTIVPLALAVGHSERDVEYHDCLFSNDRSDLERLLAEVYGILLELESKVDVAVVMTHEEIAEALPKHYADMALGQKVNKCSMKKGTAVLVDMKGQVTELK